MCIDMSNRKLCKYINTTSLMHDMNCVIKLVCTLLYAVLSFMSYDFSVNVIMLILLVILVLMSRVPIIFYVKPIWQMKWFLVFIFVINIIFNNLYITSWMLVKIISVFVYTIMLLYTTKQQDIIYGLQIIFSPLKLIKVPINKMAFSISLAIRFIPDLLNTYTGLIKAQKNRGIRLMKLGVKSRIKLLSETISSIFITSIKTSDALADIMTIRMYNVDGMVKRKLRIGLFDIFVLLLHVSLVFLVIESVII